jgi:predicted metalloendopeptidase
MIDVLINFPQHKRLDENLTEQNDAHVINCEKGYRVAFEYQLYKLSNDNGITNVSIARRNTKNCRLNLTVHISVHTTLMR